MDTISEPTAPQISPVTPPTPAELNVGDKRSQQMDRFFRTAVSVLQTMATGIGRVVQEVVDLVLRR